MKLFIDYGRDVAVLPAAVLAHVDKATKKDLRFLLALSFDRAALSDFNTHKARLAAAARMTPEEADASLAFWRGTGLVGLAERESEAEKQATAPHSSTPTVTAPAAPAAEPARISVAGTRVPYDTKELSDILSRRKELRPLIDACQQTFGKIFNSTDVEIVVWMSDHLGLDGEYILLLLSHCRNRMNKHSLRYVEKMACGLYDDGVTDAEALQDYLHRMEQMAECEARIRAMFGMGTRAFTTREKGLIEGWICRMKFSDEILKKAYEITVDTTGKPSVAYTNSILERWYADGYRTLQDVETALQDYKKKKQGGALGKLDANEFFEAALKRAYGED